MKVANIGFVTYYFQGFSYTSAEIFSITGKAKKMFFPLLGPTNSKKLCSVQ